MNKDETLKAFDNSVKTFLDKDSYLLHHNIYERSITHKLAEYLQYNFPNFNVDCEYNGDIDNIDNLRKQLNISDEVMFEIGRQKISINKIYSVYPDIIIHIRGTNVNNHLVIEVKKDNGDDNDKEFDLIKLKEFTNQYGYRMGVYIEFLTGIDASIASIRYFQNGIEKNTGNLNEI